MGEVGALGEAAVSSSSSPGRGTGRVLVLNATFEPINVCTVRRAAVLVLKAVLGDDFGEFEAENL